MKIVWSPLAIDRATKIAEDIAQDNPAAATKWVENLFTKIQLLKSSPKSGRMVPETHRVDFVNCYTGITELFIGLKKQLFQYSQLGMVNKYCQ